MGKTYALEITGTVYSYRDGDGNDLDGDRRELSSDTTTVIMDEDDAFLYGDLDEPAHVVWAEYVIETTTDAIHPSSSPIGDSVREHERLSGSYEDPYQGDSKVTETSVRLTGDWTNEDRALVFKMITRKYHTS